MNVKRNQNKNKTNIYKSFKFLDEKIFFRHKEIKHISNMKPTKPTPKNSITSE